MKKIFLLAVLFVISGCSKDDNPTEQNELITNKEFTGTVSTTIRYYDYNPYTGQDEFIEEKTYSHKVFVYVKSPVNVGSVTETNPVNLSIYPDRNSTSDEEGHLDISSALIINDPQIGRVLLQYWKLTVNGNSVSGTLTDNHIAESSAANLLWAWDEIATNLKMVMPFPLAVNTTLQGTISGNQVQLTISGESHNTYRKFTSTLTASISN